MDIEDLMTVQEAADKLNISRAAVYKAIARGDLKQVEARGKKWLLKPDVAQYHPQGLQDKRPSRQQPRG